MADRTSIALRVLAGGAFLGLLGDLLLRPLPWGLNAALWMAAFVGTAIAGTEDQPRAQRAFPYVILCLPFGLFLMWRDSTVLKLLDLFAITTLLALGARRSRDESVYPGYISDYLRAGASSIGDVLKGALPVVKEDAAWQTIPKRQWHAYTRSGLIGLILSIPLLLIFGALFFSADPVFEQYVSDFIAHGFRDAVRHLSLTLLIAWVAIGLLRGLKLKEAASSNPASKSSALSRLEENKLPSASADDKPGLGMIEIGVMLAMVNLLFASFVAVQIRYLFGGDVMVRTVDGLTYAEYARRGFFELVTVAALVLPMLLVCHLALRHVPIAGRRPFHFLAWILIALLAVIMASALHRMALYQREYGLTELRIYTVAFMLWLAVLFAWFGATVLREKRERFAMGAVAAGLAVVVLLHAVNPDAMIVRTNIGRHDVRPVDRHYLSTLSADAVPSFLKAAKDWPQASRPEAVRRFASDWNRRLEGDDWRSWSWSRYLARVSLERAGLSRIAQP